MNSTYLLINQFLFILFIIVFKVVVFISHDIRHNMTTTSRIHVLTFCNIHDSIQRDSIKKPWLMHNMTATSRILTFCIVHNCIQSDSIHTP